MIDREIINQAIREMCEEVNKQEKLDVDWLSMEEDELLYEIAICIFGSQLVFEMAETIANQLFYEKIFNHKFYKKRETMQKRIIEILDKPLKITFNDGVQRTLRPRFKNRLALLFSTTMNNIYGKTNSIKGFLEASNNARHAREILIQNICGFGPKQASLFLRRIGFCTELAVLDVHILDYLNKIRGLSLTYNKLNNLRLYEEVEEVFQEIANEFGYSIGCVDLAMWLTMRVAKREGML